MKIFKHEIADGLEAALSAKANISYASVAEPFVSKHKLPIVLDKTLASVDDSDLYYTQSILVSSSWNKNDDVFDKNEVWAARHSPEDKPTNLEHDESVIIGHIVSNWPINEDGSLIDENTSVENLPEKYHILTGSVIYKAYTKDELKSRTEALINEIESGSKYVSMECFFKGFDYGLINKANGTYHILSRDDNTAHLTKFLRAYGGSGEHEEYRIGRVLRNITFSGKGYVDKPANPDSIIFNSDSFKFLQNDSIQTKKDDILKSGVIISKSSIHSENKTMNENTEALPVVDCAEATMVADTTIATLTGEIDSLKASHAEVVTALQLELAQHEEAAKKSKEQLDQEEEKKAMVMKNMKASISDLETELQNANSTISKYKMVEKKMGRKAALINNGFDSEKADMVVEKFDLLDDDTFASMAEMLSSAGMPPWLKEVMDKKKKDKKAKADTTEEDIVEVLENVEATTDVVLSVGGEDSSVVENTRAALVEFVYARLGKNLNKGE